MPLASCVSRVVLNSELITDETAFGEAERWQFLEWCTALTALPCGGLGDRKIHLCYYVGASDETLPEVHTCTRELHLPAYTSRQAMHRALCLALEHRLDGFHKA